MKCGEGAPCIVQRQMHCKGVLQKSWGIKKVHITHQKCKKEDKQRTGVYCINLRHSVEVHVKRRAKNECPAKLAKKVWVLEQPLPFHFPHTWFNQIVSATFSI